MSGIAIVFYILGLVVTYYVIRFAVTTAIAEAQNYIKDAVAEGVLEALALRDAREKADKIEK